MTQVTIYPTDRSKRQADRWTVLVKHGDSVRSSGHLDREAAVQYAVSLVPDVVLVEVKPNIWKGEA